MGENIKEFVCTLKQTFLVNKDELITYSLLSVVSGILGIIIMSILLAVEVTDAYINIGTVIAMILDVIVVIFCEIFMIKNDFDLAISMGKTRKYFVPARYLLLVTDCLVCVGMIMLLNGIENQIYPALFSDVICGFDLGIILKNPAFLAGFVFIAPVFILLMGALFIKFATKFFWVIWVIWMLFCMCVPRVFSAAEKNPDSPPGKIGNGMIQFFAQMTSQHIIVILAVALIAGMTAIVLLFRKQRVTV